MRLKIKSISRTAGKRFKHSHHIREYRYCYGAVDAHTGEPFFLIAGACKTAWMNEFLKQLSLTYADDYIVLATDNAIWHKSRALEVPPNIEFAFIPPYSPEMNPIEQVWDEIRKRGSKNKAFKTLEEVVGKLQEVILRSVLKSIGLGVSIFDFLISISIS